jgi:GNAT superfamily N-acetyltransferase
MQPRAAKACHARRNLGYPHRNLALKHIVDSLHHMPLSIRSAKRSDVPLILQFIRELADYERLAHEVVATKATLSTTLFPGEGSPVAQCALAFAEGEPAGFAIYFFNYSTFLARPGLYLEDLFVKPAYRGRGFGKALLLHLAKIANERGCGRMEWSVLNWNQPAIDFYRRLGAVPMNEWTVFRLTGHALAQYA